MKGTMQQFISIMAASHMASIIVKQFGRWLQGSYWDNFFCTTIY